MARMITDDVVANLVAVEEAQLAVRALMDIRSKLGHNSTEPRARAAA